MFRGKCDENQVVSSFLSNCAIALQHQLHNNAVKNVINIIFTPQARIAEYQTREMQALRQATGMKGLCHADKLTSHLRVNTLSFEIDTLLLLKDSYFAFNGNFVKHILSLRITFALYFR